LISDQNRIRVAIVDDEQLARERMRSLLSEHSDVELVAECADGAEAIRAIEEKQPDLVFLDVQMPDVDGFEVVEALERHSEEAAEAATTSGPTGTTNGSQRPAIVFVTAHDDHALRAFEIHALDFLLKPFDQSRFDKTLARARWQLGQSRSTVDARLVALLEDLRAERHGRKHSDRLVVKSAGRVFFLRTEDIDWVEAAGNYVRLHTHNEAHLLRESMKNMESRLDPSTFVRIHRSAIVNIDRVKELEPWFHGEYIVIMRDGTRLTASRVYSDRLSAMIE
jgi:two-component system LytT family response regulator